MHDKKQKETEWNKKKQKDQVTPEVTKVNGPHFHQTTLGF